MVATVASLLNSTTIGLSKYTYPKVFITFWLGNLRLSWCQTCPTLIGIGRIGISLYRGWTRYVYSKSGIVYLMGLITLGVF